MQPHKRLSYADEPNDDALNYSISSIRRNLWSRRKKHLLKKMYVTAAMLVCLTAIAPILALRVAILLPFYAVIIFVPIVLLRNKMNGLSKQLQDCAENQYRYFCACFNISNRQTQKD